MSKYGAELRRRLQIREPIKKTNKPREVVMADKELGPVTLAEVTLDEAKRFEEKAEQHLKQTAQLFRETLEGSINRVTSEIQFLTMIVGALHCRDENVIKGLLEVVQDAKKRMQQMKDRMTTAEGDGNTLISLPLSGAKRTRTGRRS